MNHKIYQKMINERLRDDKQNQQEMENSAEITVVYTSSSLVKAGQKIMRDRRKLHSERLEPA